ncbi:MAG: hypothetical protein JKX73_09735 [Flavobacteriales bacterium]|nr:hypothetical protein [Flavobacteriales bacterium]
MDVTLITQPDMEIFGIRVMEPVTSVTDILVAVVCFYAYWRLKKANVATRSAKYMQIYFLTMGFATFFGGMIGHAFLYAVNEYWKLLGWYISMISVAVIERSAIQYARRLIKPALGRAFMIINIVELLTFMIITAVTLHFRFVQVHAAYGFLVVVFSFHLFTYWKTKDEGSKMFLRSISVLFVAAFIFNYPVVLHEWFNHRDFAHILMAIGTYLFMLGTLKFEQAPKKTRESN